ncbi:MAG: hypothetical protein IH597_00460 [Bacteroidales bacterium]|nr:hypothetical protein [Bacteroidales bacterium]
MVIGLLPFKWVAAQKLRGDAVYLRNGSVVTGHIIQNDSIRGLKISNDCGIWFYEPHEIDSTGRYFGDKYFSSKERGYVNISSFGLLFGYENFPIPSLTMVHGMKVNSGISGGVGIGYEYFDWGVVPVFADARYYFHDAGFSPYLLAQAGYAITLERNPNNNWGNLVRRNFGGPLLSVGAGIRAGISKNSAFTFSIAYRFQKLSYKTTSEWEPGTTRIVENHYNRIAVTVGFLFE